MSGRLLNYRNPADIPYLAKHHIRGNQVITSAHLRPTFFRAKGSRVHSGWKTRVPSGGFHYDIWAYPETLMEMTEYMGPEAPYTKEAITAMVPNDLWSVVVPGASLALLIGERVVFTEDYEFPQMACVQRGDRGIICKIDRVTGERWLWLEAHHNGLMSDSNTVSIVPHFEGELLAILDTYSDRYSSVPTYPQETTNANRRVPIGGVRR